MIEQVFEDGPVAVLDPDADEVAEALRWWSRHPELDVGPADLSVGPTLSAEPGQVLAGALEAAACGLHDGTDADVVEVVGAAQRIMNWALGVQLQAIGELHARYAAPKPGQPEGMGRLEADFAAGEVEQEVALACRITENAASMRLRAARQLDERLPVTRAAVRRGQLDWTALTATVDSLQVLDDATAAAVERAVVPELLDPDGPVAAGMNPAVLRRRLNRAAIAADPAAADRRAAEARRERRVCFRPEPDGMASLWMLGPAPDMLLAHRCLDELARAQQHPGDTRTADQRRVDAFVARITGRDAAPGSPNGGGPTGRAEPQVTVLVPLSTLVGSGDGPGELLGAGAIPPEMARDLAERGAWRCAVVDDEHRTLLGLGSRTFTPQYRPGAALERFVRIRDRQCVVPGCNATAQRGDLDHRVPHDDGPTCECNLQALCRKHHGRKHRGGLRAEPDTRPGEPPGTMTWTTRSGTSYRQVPEPFGDAAPGP